jgi:RNA polymerase sigma-70 factor, ECF subfamily
LIIQSERETKLKSLFLRGLDGDSLCYQQALKGLSDMVRGFLRKRLMSLPDEVEDLVQEILLAVHNQRHVYDQGQPLTAWVHTIARYKLVDFLRWRRRQGVHVDIADFEDELMVEDSNPGDARRDVLGLLDGLPEKHRAAIQTVKIDGFSVAEAALKTGQSESSIKVGIHRGLKALAKKMKALS